MRFIAEVSSNHNQDLDRAQAFIRAAAAAKCDAVKFQLFKIEQLFAPEILARSEKIRRRKDWELPVSFLPVLHATCRENQIAFGCTPFYLGAVAELERYVDFYKIASYELLWTPLLEACARTGKPVILSTGMATLPEIQAAVATLRAAGCQDLTLLHCVSAYPCPPAECNLSAIKTIRDATGCAVGWSDHSVSSAILHRAIHYWGATAIEFHLDLEGKGAEANTGHCWLPAQIRSLIADIITGEQANGSGIKAPTPAEAPDREWRADPSDGLRPFLHIRQSWQG
jgi:sialic acid synthase SpsE